MSVCPGAREKEHLLQEDQQGQSQTGGWAGGRGGTSKETSVSETEPGGRRGRKEAGSRGGQTTWKQRSGLVDCNLREKGKQGRVLSKGVTSFKRSPGLLCRGRQGADWGPARERRCCPPRAELPRFCTVVKGFLDGSDVGGREESRTPASGSKDLE